MRAIRYSLPITMVILAFCFHISLIVAAQSNTIIIDNATYTYSISGNEISIDKVSTEAKNIVIPEQINGFNVTGIGKSACRDCTFETVELPESIEIISDYAFECCENLVTIKLPSRINSLGKECFSECTSLKNVVLPESLKEISELCFGNCISLTNIIIPDGVTKLDTAAFNGCSTLTTINIPDSVTEIGNVVFAGNSLLKNIDWNQNVSSIGRNVFKDTKYLSEYAGDFLLLNNGTLLYKYTGNNDTPKIPESVTQIADCAFQDTRISSVELPLNIEEVPVAMFSGCSSLKSITIPEGYIGIAGSAFSGCSALTEIQLPQTLQYIKDSAFSECSSLKKIIIPDNVETIGDKCFIDCSALNTVQLSSKLTRLGDKAFYNCNELKTINIPNGIINNISSKTFSPAAHLENVTIDGKITSALANALSVAHYSGDLSEDMYIVDGVLMNYNGAETDVVIPETVIEIGKNAFAAGVKLTSVVIPDSVLRIGDRAFYGQSELVNIEIPGSVKSIGQLAFSNCINLRDIIFESGTETLVLGASAFQFTAVTEGTLETTGRNYINKEDAFKNTSLDPEYHKDTINSATENPASTNIIFEQNMLNILSGKEGISINANGKNIIFEDAKPFIDQNGRTQIPIRAVAEAMDCNVDWDEQTQTVTLSKGSKTVIIKIGDANMQTGKSIVTMDTTAQIVNDRTYIPVRFAGEALGMEVNWIE